MHFRVQLDRSLAVLSERGLSRHHAEPLLFRLLWKLGINVRPPHFLGFASIAIVYGTWFACAWGVFMWLLVWSHQGVGLAGVALRAAAAGACFGLLMAWFYARERREFALPAWESLGQE
jgi:membrane associated rhomboid family serine protease